MANATRSTASAQASVACSVRPEGIPAALKGAKYATRWLVWRNIRRDGKLTKVPFHPLTGGALDATKTSNGASYDDAWRAYRRKGSGYAGIGFILGDGIAGVDVDNCIEPATGELDERGQRISQRFKRTYAEISPSGTGFKVLVRVPEGTEAHGTKGDGVECYAERRYFALTGQPLAGHARSLALLPAEFAATVAEVGGASRLRDPGESGGPAPLHHDQPGTRRDLLKVKRALKHLSSDSYGTWQAYAAAMRRAFRHDPELEQQAFDAWHDWSAKSAKYDGEDACRAKWEQSDTAANVAKPITIATIIADGNDAKAKAEAFAAQLAESPDQRSARGVATEHEIDPAEVGAEALEHIVAGLLTIGFHFLVAAPKFGKTWLFLQIARALGTGGRLWGRKVARPYRVCVLALEEGDEFDASDPAHAKRQHPKDRIARRLRKLGYSKHDMNNVRFVFEIAPYSDGGLEAIDALAQRYDVLLIDSAVMLRIGAAQSGNNVWNSDYVFVKPLQRMASTHGKLIMLIAHSGKGANSRDPEDAIAGTQGLQAASDGMWILQRPDPKRKDRVRLHLTSRELPTCQLELRWDNDRAGWQCLGSWLDLTEQDRRILAALAAVPASEAASYRAIAESTMLQESDISERVGVLAGLGLVEVSNAPSSGQRGRPPRMVALTIEGRDRFDEGWDPADMLV